MRRDRWEIDQEHLDRINSLRVHRGKRPLTTLAEWDTYSDLAREYQNAGDPAERASAYERLRTLDGPAVDRRIP